MNKINVTYKGRVIGKGYSSIETKPKPNHSYKITEYETTQNGVSDFDDQTELYKKIYDKHKFELRSKNAVLQTKSALTLLSKLEIVAGRKLTKSEQQNIIKHSKQKAPLMKINKYGRLFTTVSHNSRMNTSIAKETLWYKGEENG